jgi:hypothetical protein
VTLESTGATAVNGVATVKLRCNLSTACHGAFLLCLPFSSEYTNNFPIFCDYPPGAIADGGRLAGSDFVAAAGTTANVRVALTDIGKQGASAQGGVKGNVIIDLLNYGLTLDTTGSLTGTFVLTSADPPIFPVGATASCGPFVFAGPNTSCPFAKNVEKAYKATKSDKNATVTAFSPATGQTYVMHCTVGTPVACRGGTNGLVEFYF